jgi:type IV secretion system protein VirB6
MFGFFLSGNIIVVICGLIFVIVFASIVLYYLTAYLVCLVTLYVMAYISPIFIPMVLFEQTKAYFDSWMKITLSCALQPAVIGGFLALILTMYDSAIYGTCEFQRHDYTFGNTNFSTFELRIPNNQPEECVNSAGYKLMKYYMGEGWKKMFLLIFVLRSLQDTLGLLTSMTYVLVFTFIFYFFVKSINDFASDLTGGASIESVSAATNKTIDKIAKAFSAAASFGKAAASSGGKKKTTSSTSSDKSRGGGVSGALNKASGGASDKVSVGGKK